MNVFLSAFCFFLILLFSGEGPDLHLDLSLWREYVHSSNNSIEQNFKIIGDFVPLLPTCLPLISSLQLSASTHAWCLYSGTRMSGLTDRMSVYLFITEIIFFSRI